LKPTNFYSNIFLDLLQSKGKQPKQMASGYDERSKIPPQLIQHITNTMLDKIGEK
jgi:hypothetical protein